MKDEEVEEFEQQCERCGDYFKAAEENSLCPKCEAS
jgi:Zn finger protein HypA/HybF involved in hydrogenase expression